MNIASDKPPRFASVDALRGCTVAAMLLVNDPGDWEHIYWPLEHSAWNGCTPTDLVFPFFLFVVGVSVALGIEPRVQRGGDNRALRNAALWRAARIVGLGLLLNLLGWWIMPQVLHYRVPGVLQRIGLCFALTAVLVIYTRPRTQLWITGLLLVAYAWLLHAGGGLAPWTNIASRIDSAVFQSHVYEIDPLSGRGHDPEGLLSSLPSLVNCLLGLWAGRWLREGRGHRLIIGGISQVLVGWVWSYALPLNKNLWTPSFVLWTSGWAMLAVALFHYLIDRRGMKPWGRRFGVNAVVAYALSDLLIFFLVATGWLNPLYQHGFVETLSFWMGPWNTSLVFALAFVVVCWLVVWLLDRKRIYFKL